MPRKQELVDAVRELKNWLPSELPEYGEMVFSFLSSLPGGEEAEDAGAVPLDFIGWKEAEMLGKLLANLGDASDVEYATKELMGGDED